MSKENIFLGDAFNYGRVYKQDVKDALGIDTVYTKEYLLNNMREFADTEYIFTTWGMPHFTKQEITSCLPALKAIFYAAGSVQAFAREFLECGVKVFSAWAANAVPVAEFTVSEIVLANKGYFACSKAMKEQRTNREAAELSGKYPGNYKSTVGIIGCGMIGRMIAKTLVERKYTVLTYDPYMSLEQANELGVEKVELDELFGKSDVVTNHVANNSSTVGMIQGRHFELMKKYSTFINTGRGAQIKENEMIEVLSKRLDITALLDVTWPEPPASDSKLYNLPNVILTPHIAGSLSGECERMAEYMKDEYYRLINGRKCLWEVNLEMLDTMA